MGIYVLKRVLLAIPTLLVASLLIFSLVHLAPGGPIRVMLGQLQDPELIERLRQKGVRVVWFTLHMGLGSFRPIRVEEVEQHRLPPEVYTLPPETASEVNRAKAEGRRVIACGTGAVRVLEGVAAEGGRLRAGSGMVDLFIMPGYRFRVVDGMITNFHLPRSSHLVLVSAFAGRDLVMRAYNWALERGFRFLSFGDAMLIL